MEWEGKRYNSCLHLKKSSSGYCMFFIYVLVSGGTAGEADDTDSIPGQGLTWTQIWEEALGGLHWDKQVGKLWCLWQCSSSV